MFRSSVLFTRKTLPDPSFAHQLFYGERLNQAAGLLFLPGVSTACTTRERESRRPDEGLAVRRRRISEEGDPVAIDVAEDEPPRSSSAGFLCERNPGFAHPPLMGVEVIYG